MRHYAETLIYAFLDGYRYLNRLPVRYWLPLILSCLFLGWNGLQIIFSPNLILAFVDTNSVTELIYNTLEFQLRSIPIYIFIVVSFILIHWLIHSLVEIGFTHILHGEEINISRIIATGLNFYVPNLLIVIAIFFIVQAIFMLSIFLQIAFSGFSITLITGIEVLFYRAIGLSLFLSFMVTMWLTDFVLPRMAKGFTFKHALLRSIIIFNNRSLSLVTFYIIKLVLIVVSVILFQIVLRHLLLPFFIMLEAQFSISLTLFSGRELAFDNLFSNLVLIIAIFLSALLVFAPFMAPMYLFQRFLLFRLYKA